MDNSFYRALYLGAMVGGLLFGILWVVATEMIDF